MTIAARFRFLSLGCAISRLTWARLSSPLMASMEWPKAIRMPNRPKNGTSRVPLQESKSIVAELADCEGMGDGGRCAPRSNTV